MSYVSYRVNTVLLSASPGQAVLIKIRQALDAGYVGPDLGKIFNDAGYSLADSAARSKPISPGNRWQLTSTRGSYDVEIQGDVLTVRAIVRKTLDMPPLTNGTSGYSCSH